MTEAPTPPVEPNVPPERLRGQWRAAIRGNVLALGLVSLFTDFSSEMIFPLIPAFLAGLVGPAAAPLALGLMEGLAETTASLLKLVSGRVSDRLGRRKPLVLLGYGLSSVARPLVALAGAAWQVIGLRFADRVGKGLRTSPRDALISESVAPKVRGFAYSFHRAMDHLGAVLGPLAAVAVLWALLGYGLWHGAAQGGQPSADEMNALRWLFGLALVPGLIAVACVVLGVRDQPRHQPRDAGRAQPGDQGHDQARADERPAPKGGAGASGHGGSTTGWRALPGRFWAVVGVVTVFALGNSSDLFLIYYGTTRFGLGLTGLIGMWLVLHLAKIVFSVPGGILSDRLGRTPLLLAGWLVYALVYLGFALTTAQWQIWALLAAYGLFYGLTEGAEKALVADLVPAGVRGTAFGVYHAAVGLAALPASLLFGVFWIQLGPVTAFSIGAGLAGLAMVLLFGLTLATRRAARV